MKHNNLNVIISKVEKGKDLNACGILTSYNVPIKIKVLALWLKNSNTKSNV